MHVQIVGAEHVALASTLARSAVRVSLVVSDADDRARLQDMSARLEGALAVVAAPLRQVDLVLGGHGGVALDWRAATVSIHLSQLPSTPLLLEQIGADPTHRIDHLARHLGASHIKLPSGHVPVSARLLAALGRAIEQLMLDGAAPIDLDEALVAVGWMIGPAEMQDLMGVDTALATRRAVHQNLGVADDLPLFPRAVSEGRLGRKVGVGWHRYPGNGGKVEDPLVEDMAAEEARFAKIDQSFPDARAIVDRVHQALHQARVAMPDMTEDEIDMALHCAVGLPRGGL